ncbi:hypothetical protein Hanom_Chr11g01015431 [Helianthus anomalus]
MANNLTTVVQNIKHNAEVSSSDKPPLRLHELDYPELKERFERYDKSKDVKLWLGMTTGLGAPPIRNLSIVSYLALTEDQKKFYECEEKAMSMITMALPQYTLLEREVPQKTMGEYG